MTLPPNLQDGRWHGSLSTRVLSICARLAIHVVAWRSERLSATRDSRLATGLTNGLWLRVDVLSFGRLHIPVTPASDNAAIFDKLPARSVKVATGGDGEF